MQKEQTETRMENNPYSYGILHLAEVFRPCNGIFAPPAAKADWQARASNPRETTGDWARKTGRGLANQKKSWLHSRMRD